jgi:hypothetical protein
MLPIPPGERVSISGGRKLACNWSPYKNGIMMASAPPGLEFTQLFINGKRQIRARYPNYDPSNPGRSGYVQPAGLIGLFSAEPVQSRPVQRIVLAPMSPWSCRRGKS